MIEVLFGDSDAGSMRAALQSGKLGSDAVCLGFALDIGDIKKPVTSKYRAKLLYSLLYQEQWGADPEAKRELKRLGSVYSKELDKLARYVKGGEDIRVWYSGAPYSMCGLMWLCARFREYSVTRKIYAVKLPNIISNGETAVMRSGWGEVKPDEFAKLLPLQRRLQPIEIVMNAVDWDGLRSQNAPLRAVVNGFVTSVPASFYDFLIWKYLGDSPVKEAYLIGIILAENPLGIADRWYARRIDKFIAQNRIKIVENSPEKYERIIARNTDKKSPEKTRPN